MNLYQRMWDQCGYAKRYRCVMATSADRSRKLAALARIWNRMVEKL